MLVIGHRGASAHALENTLAAFRLCVESPRLRCDGVELDIHTTADGALVVHHDAQFPSGGKIHEMSMAEVAATPLADGSVVPALEEALAVLEPIEVFIEIKGISPPGFNALERIVLAHPHPDRLNIHAFDHRILRELASRTPEFQLGALSASYPIDPVGPVLAAGARTLWQEWHLIDAALVAQCTAAGVRVIAWTVNDRETAERLESLGVAAVCGNWPERLRTGVSGQGENETGAREGRR